MEDQSAPAPTPADRNGADRKNPISLTIVTVTAGLGAVLLMSGLAHAEPMVSTATTLSKAGILSQLHVGNERALFGALTFGFSLLAAGVWHRSFRAVLRSKRPSRH